MTGKVEKKSDEEAQGQWKERSLCGEKEKGSLRSQSRKEGEVNYSSLGGQRYYTLEQGYSFVINAGTNNIFRKAFISRVPALACYVTNI